MTTAEGSPYVCASCGRELDPLLRPTCDCLFAVGATDALLYQDTDESGAIRWVLPPRPATDPLLLGDLAVREFIERELEAEDD